MDRREVARAIASHRGCGSRVVLLLFPVLLLLVHTGNAAEPTSLSERNEANSPSDNGGTPAQPEVHRQPFVKRPFCNIYGGCSAAYQLGSRKRWLFAPSAAGGGGGSGASSAEGTFVRSTNNAANMPSEKELDDALTVIAAAEGSFLKNAYRARLRDLFRP
ncbi:uncharacterized protein LOC129585330 [Paramacrobiotus metropolitanus]|uniref:uncharacterized protein LOC129585330 n=1 Tax=Paramacrobiotus metropolitanus TaxID=2943436 RepID=UPI002445CA09|nr:uncharacterized protein LOC129585330 [Paramacrobiotus metropolitanus]